MINSVSDHVSPSLERSCPTLLPQWSGLANSEMLLDAVHPPEQVREQLALGGNSPLGGDRFEIASKVLRRDPR